MSSNKLYTNQMPPISKFFQSTGAVLKRQKECGTVMMTETPEWNLSASKKAIQEHIQAQRWADGICIIATVQTYGTELEGSTSRCGYLGMCMD